MEDRQLKEYKDYLGLELRNNKEITSAVYTAALKALELPEFLFINEKDKKAAVFPSMNEGDFILIANIEGRLTISYEKTQALGVDTPFKSAVKKILSNDNEIYGLQKLFEFSTKDEKGELLFYKQTLHGEIITPDVREAMLEVDHKKRFKLIDKLFRPAGTCLSAMSGLDSLKAMSDTFNGLKVMKKIPSSQFKNLGKAAAAHLQPDVEQFLEDLNYLYQVSKENNHTTKNAYTFGNDKIWLPTLKNTVCFQSQGIGYVAQKTNENDWAMYPYAKEYCLNTSVKDVLSKIKNNEINDTLECILKIENGKITHLGSLLYNMAIELYECVREYDTEYGEIKNPKSKNKMK